MAKNKIKISNKGHTRPQLVRQEDSFGCGVACVASVLGINYKKALNLFRNGKKRAQTKANFFCREIADILNKNQKNRYRYKYIKKHLRRKIYQERTIVFVKKSNNYPFGHYLVRAEGKWMDPWINIIENKDPDKAKAGWRKRVPGSLSYAIYCDKF